MFDCLIGVANFVLIFSLFVHCNSTKINPFNELTDVTNIWSFGQEMELYVYISNEPIQTVFNDKDIVAHFKSIVYGDEIKPLSVETTVLVDSSEKSLFLHLHLTKAGIHPDPLISPFEPLNIVYRRLPLMKTMKRPSKKVNLLSTEARFTLDSKNANEKDFVSFWYPEVTINLVKYHDKLDLNTFPPVSRRFIYVDRIRKMYYPVLFINEFWDLKEKRIALTEKSKKEKLPLKISFSTTSMFKFKLMTQIDFAIKQQESNYGELNEFDNIKRLLLEISPWHIVITLVISLLHSVFYFLAFKNEIQFWKKKKDFSGLSLRSIIFSGFCQLIIFFYLLDSETSWLILVSSGIATIIEFWKVTKTFQVKWVKIPNIHFLYIPSFHDQSSYIKSKTREYDDTAIKFLFIVSIPLIFGYSFWSLYYHQHKSWYSWIIKSLVGFVYTFGFISMTPQLFINYKLKSVAPMPWKAFIYKALNTFIDDLFAFVIKMPWMHRIACFRDDILFMIYLYQLWIYPVDMNRANEFGQTGNSDPTENVDKSVVVDSRDKNESSARKDIRKRKSKLK